MNTLQEAARNAIKLLEELRGISYLKYEHTAIENSAKELRSALAQQGEQQPVCHGCGIPAGDVHMSTCKSGKWPSRVSNGDTAAPAPQAQPVAQSLTDKRISWLWSESHNDTTDRMAFQVFARAIEAAHGIREVNER